MNPLLDTSDWEEVFAFADKVDTPLGSDACTNSFTREDVSEILLLIEGEADCERWMGCFHLKDDRYVYLEASCCYTGWDVSSNGSAVACTSPLELATMGMNDFDRKNYKKLDLKYIDPRFEKLLEGLSNG